MAPPTPGALDPESAFWASLGNRLAGGAGSNVDQFFQSQAAGSSGVSAPTIGKGIYTDPKAQKQAADNIIQDIFGDTPVPAALRDKANKAALAQLQSGSSYTDAMNSILTSSDVMAATGGTPAQPGGTGGVPDGWVVLPSGKWMNPLTGAVVDPNSSYTPGMPQGRTAAEENASNASANANNAQAEQIRATMARDALIQSAIDHGELHETSISGVFFTPDGKILDKNAIDATKAQTAIAQGTLNETVRKDLISEAIDKQRVGIEQQNSDQTGEFQRGEIANQQFANEDNANYHAGQLTNDTARLSIEKAQQAAQQAYQQQQSALAKDQYVSGILKGPSDFIARAFNERGQASPNTPITHADLINQVNSQFANLQPGQTFAPPPVAPGAPGTLLQPPTQPPALANGGMVRDRLLIAGDTQSPQQGTGNPEYISNPTGAPIAVIPMNRLSGQQPKAYANGTTGQANGANTEQPRDPAIVQAEQKVKGISRLLQHVENPGTQHQLVDELAEARGRLSQPGVKAYANGTGVPQDDFNTLYSKVTTDPTTSYDTYNNGSNYQSTTNPMSGQTRGVDPASGATYTSTPLGSGPTPGYKPPPAGRLTPPSGVSAVDNAPQNPWGSAVTVTPGKLMSDYHGAGVGTSDYLTWLRSPLGPGDSNYVAPIVPLTQDQLNAQADAAAPPAVRSLFGANFGKALPTADTTPNPLQPGGLAPLRFPFGMFSPASLNGLTQDELKALDSYLGVRYNTTLQDVVNAQQQVYNTPQGTRGGRLAPR